MPPFAGHVARRCQSALNTFHSLTYFSPDLDKQLAGLGVGDPMACYLAGRAAALGRVGPGVVTAAFYSFRHDLVARHVPAVWDLVSPQQAWAGRVAAADSTLSRLLGPDVLRSRPVEEAARLVLRAAEGAQRPGRPMYAAHADMPAPPAPHLSLWYGATLLREHRGDSHVAVLRARDLDGLEALVSHCASEAGMPREIVMAKRGWTEEDWRAAEERLRGRGLMAADGSLTRQGRTMRADLEEATDRADAAPYRHLGQEGVVELTAYVEELVRAAIEAGGIPAPLAGFFAPPER
ncbi:hypothetical protein ACFYSH_18425 [Streptomyces sp. NPDC005791]|uniref:SCO6745 family protein n=1 Tax=unclassified Streptomyces TaxID=2593676 RepID=UPI0033D7EAC1